MLVQGRQETYNHKLKNLVQKPAKDWTRVENSHDPIIPRQRFELVQMIASLDTRTAPESKEVYLFSGILICGCCGGRMTRKTNTVKGKKYVYYYCPTGKKNGCDRAVMLKEDDLKRCVLDSLRAHIRSVASVDAMLNSIDEDRMNRELIAGFKAQIADNEAQLAQVRRFKSTIYENMVEGMIDKAEYQDLRSRYAAQTKRAQEAIDRLRGEMERAAGGAGDRLRWVRHFQEFSNLTELDRRAVIALVQSIKVIGKTELEITFRYDMEYQAAKEKLSLAKEAG